MNLTIDTERITELGLTINEYLILMTAYYQEHGEMLDFSSTQEELQKLERDMLIKITPKGAVLREKGWKIFDNFDKSKFEEFLDIYPKSVPSGGGERSTAPSDKESHWANQLRRVWNSEVSNEDEVIQKLKYEVEEKKRRGELMYLPKVDRWLTEHMWERVIITEFKSNEKSI